LVSLINVIILFFVIVLVITWKEFTEVFNLTKYKFKNNFVIEESSHIWDRRLIWDTDGSTKLINAIYWFHEFIALRNYLIENSLLDHACSHCKKRF